MQLRSSLGHCQCRTSNRRRKILLPPDLSLAEEEGISIPLIAFVISLRQPRQRLIQMMVGVHSREADLRGMNTFLRQKPGEAWMIMPTLQQSLQPHQVYRHQVQEAHLHLCPHHHYQRLILPHNQATATQVPVQAEAVPAPNPDPTPQVSIHQRPKR